VSVPDILTLAGKTSTSVRAAHELVCADEPTIADSSFKTGGIAALSNRRQHSTVGTISRRCQQAFRRIVIELQFSDSHFCEQCPAQ
jgi:hypothetical protein